MTGNENGYVKGQGIMRCEIFLFFYNNIYFLFKMLYVTHEEFFHCICEISGLVITKTIVSLINIV